jgi:hypothetical protein
MELGKIVYYTREGIRHSTISLRELCLYEDVDLESIFYAGRDAVDAHDLLNRLTRICRDPIALDEDDPTYVRFTVYDTAHGRINYLKFNKRRIIDYGT